MRVLMLKVQIPTRCRDTHDIKPKVLHNVRTKQNKVTKQSRLAFNIFVCFCHQICYC